MELEALTWQTTQTFSEMIARPDQPMFPEMRPQVEKEETDGTDHRRPQRLPGLRQLRVVAAGDYFDLDDDALVIVLREDLPDSDRSELEEAARSCPVSALVVED
ncbi:ferredoxin [Microbacterium sp. NRRL B-14842]|uniref:ferredoxin n=1 Tax=Microbacterium sp. NRRL B-14842 TaxID=3162881 RepID=UPI003D293A8F